MSGNIIQNFQTIINTARDACTSLGRGLRQLQQRRWFFSAPAGGQAKPGKFDFAGVHMLFDRSEAESNFVTALEQPESHTRQDLAMAKVQSDLISGMERDYTLRHRSRIRRLAHESVSKAHAGSSRGVFQTNLMFYLESQSKRIEPQKTNGQP